jgi:Fe2+-dicitrate sensor, membrane component
MDEKKAAEIYSRYLKGQATPEEIAWLESANLRLARGQQVPAYDRENAKASVKSKIANSSPSAFPGEEEQSSLRPRRLAIIRYTAAAAILLALSVSLYFFVFNADSPREIAATEIPPGTNRATLTLADGRTVDLSTAQAGIVVGDGITYLDGSEISDAGQSGGEESLTFDVSRLMSLTTPKGGTYQITLPDGSRVWLNAASRLKYPSRFNGEERVVELEGEAYFDVAKATVPFRVVGGGQMVEVLGTGFNISAYADEDETTTTLVEGSVRLHVGATGTNVSLSPGEQGRLSNGEIQTRQVDTEQYTAWKDGYFKLDGTLAGVMAQVSRWYDVEVVFSSGVDTHRELVGEVSRDASLGDILWMISEVDRSLKFKVEELTPADRNGSNQRERRLTVMK